jgi:hypothetical protein
MTLAIALIAFAALIAIFSRWAHVPCASCPDGRKGKTVQPR